MDTVKPTRSQMIQAGRKLRKACRQKDLAALQQVLSQSPQPSRRALWEGLSACAYKGWLEGVDCLLRLPLPASPACEGRAVVDACHQPEVVSLFLTQGPSWTVRANEALQSALIHGSSKSVELLIAQASQNPGEIERIFLFGLERLRVLPPLYSGRVFSSFGPKSWRLEEIQEAVAQGLVAMLPHIDILSVAQRCDQTQKPRELHLLDTLCVRALHERPVQMQASCLQTCFHELSALLPLATVHEAAKILAEASPKAHGATKVRF